jgi:choline dehydrogenase-like flavoprotein
MESLGYGGLGAGWGLGSYVYSQGECEKVGLPYAAMQDSYQFVADHIGVSGGDDDVSPLILGSLKNIQAPLIPDNAAQKLFAKYQKNKAFFEKNKAYFGHPAMAILTADKGERKATSYFDTDFYADIHQSAYRPQFTIDALKNEPNFTYHGGQLVLSFTDKESAVEVNSLDLASNSKQVFKAKKLVIAAGALGTARLVMRSLPQISRLPLLCNPYAYVPGIQWSMLGKKLDSKKSSMAQAMMIYDADGKNDDLVSLAFYTYQSLMLFRLIKESPLNIADNRILFQYLQSAFVIAGVHHPDRASDLKYLTLDNRSDSLSSDILMASYQLTGDEKINIRDREKVIWKLLNKLGVMPIKKLDPGAGSSIHYGGTVPFSITDKLGTQSPDGRLYATKNVFIADSSGFNFLPAKGVTLSLMANANRVCKYLIAYD